MEAFVKFLENESQPRIELANAPTLLNIHPQGASAKSAESSANTSSSSVENAEPTGVVQPIMLSDAMLQNFSTQRNSSSILKDILSDS